MTESVGDSADTADDPNTDILTELGDDSVDKHVNASDESDAKDTA